MPNQINLEVYLFCIVDAHPLLLWMPPDAFLSEGLTLVLHHPTQDVPPCLPFTTGGFPFFSLMCRSKTVH